MAEMGEGDETIEGRNIGAMWDLEQKLDQPMDEEAHKLKNMYKEKGLSTLMLLRLAFQSLGIVYGDLGTSPLYVFYNTFPDGIDDTEDVIGALSLIIYSLLLVPLIKYVFIVCKANDNGQGGTLAIYSLLCRNGKLKLIPDEQRSDQELTTYGRTFLPEGSIAAKTMNWLEKKDSRKRALLIIVLVGTCMTIGDGIFTPAISVLSATGGIKVNNPQMSSDTVVIVAVLILVGLFSMQQYGTDKVAWLFAPIVFIWLLFIGATGLYNICIYDTSVLKAFSPTYIYKYFRRRGRDGWVSLGGILLSITGTEALYDDIAYFPLLAIQLAFTFFVFPCLLLAYCGQAAYLVKNKDNYANAFYESIPGTAVAVVMLVTTLLMVLLMLLVWQCHWSLILVFTVLSLVVEGAYFSAVLLKVNQGGWLPLVIAAVLLAVMIVWNYVKIKRYEFQVHSKVSMSWIIGLGPSLGLVRVPGVGIVYSELASGVPHIFSHVITNLPAIHSVVVFVCVKYLPVYTVPEEERFLVKRIGSKTFRMFRCVARYGYKDLHKKDDNFENKLFNNLFSFIQIERMMEPVSNSSNSSSPSICSQPHQSIELLINNNDMDMFSSIVDYTVSTLDTIIPLDIPRNAASFCQDRAVGEEETNELEFLKNGRESGVVHIQGNTVVKARINSSLPKKIAINYVYAFLKKICRGNNVIFNVPHESLLNVGQVFYV
ncbi:Potassium transporter 9 [Raphanus sativus]|nr:Potassium transporter 9 [Raphanus sativus]